MKDSSLPERIRSKRGSRGRKGYLSQFALAVKLGVSCALVQKAESGAERSTKSGGGLRISLRTG